MTKKMYSPKGEPEAARFSDGTMRCRKCHLKNDLAGQLEMGTPMVMHVIYCTRTDKQIVAIGKVNRCGNPRCDEIGEMALSKAAQGAGITKANVYALMRERSGVPHFTLKELLAGKAKAVKLPASIAAMVEDTRPAFASGYNPNAHIEPIRTDTEGIF